jgi:glycosyltransferase involved in cell wall biosynthesis
MQFVIHGATLRGFGSSYVGRSICDHLPAFPEHDFIVLVPRSWPKTTRQTSNITYRVMPGGWPGKAGVEFWHLPRLGRAADATLALTDTSSPRSVGPQVLLVQNAYIAYDWRSIDVPMRFGFAAKMRAIERYFALSRRKVDVFTVQTESMKRRLSEKWAIPAEDIHVVPSTTDVSSISRKQTGIEPIIACVTSAAPHKNLHRLPEMMQHLKALGSRLRCVVTVSSSLVPEVVDDARRRNVGDSLEFIGSLDRERVQALLSRALCSLAPTLLESFGLPYFEAMANECPVIAADVDFAREACGDAALYADGTSPRSFAEAIHRLTEDPGLRAQLVAAGLGRVQSRLSSWSTITGRYVALLTQVAGAGKA